jgi:protein tyrosine/serine phosphatase
VTGPSGSDRVLRWEALLNARDLGGIPTANGPVRHGALVRSDALYRLNDAGRAALVAHGVRTVIDMRAQREIDAKTYAFEESFGVVRHHIPQQTEDMWAANAGLDRITNDVTMLEVAQANFARIADAIATAPEGGVLYHCEVGKDRTGLMTMVLLDLVGTPEDVIAADYALTAVGLESLFADLIAKAEDAARRARLEFEAQCRGEVMLMIYRLFRKRTGGAEAYLRAGGMSAASVDALRRRLLDGAGAAGRETRTSRI